MKVASFAIPSACKAQTRCHHGWARNVTVAVAGVADSDVLLER
jgi:hypothetical protein